MERKTLIRCMAFAVCTLPGLALATNGYYSHGNGIKAKSMGGAATATAEDAFGGANNPASMVFAGGRFDTGIDFFNPERSATRTGSANAMGPGDPGRDGAADSDTRYFAIPELGYNKMLSNDLSLGVSVYGNGGMNTNYPGGQVAANHCGAGAPASNLLCGQGSLGVDLVQLLIAPTLAYKLSANHAIGVSPLIGYQRFQAEGLQAFAGMSSAPDKVTNNGYDNSYGFGVRIGYMGKITPSISIGAAYATKMKMSEFDKYAGLFAEQGRFDMPENYNAGIAFQASEALMLALDYQRINYASIRSIGNPSTNRMPLGSDGGPGFGWKNVNVWKLGARYQLTPQWTVRAGFNRCDNPVVARDITFNLLAPGVITRHATLGATYRTAGGTEWSLSGMHGFENSVSGPSAMLGGNETASMRQTSVGIALGWKL